MWGHPELIYREKRGGRAKILRYAFLRRVSGRARKGRYATGDGAKNRFLRYVISGRPLGRTALS